MTTRSRYKQVTRCQRNSSSRRISRCTTSSRIAIAAILDQATDERGFRFSHLSRPYENQALYDGVVTLLGHHELREPGACRSDRGPRKPFAGREGTPGQVHLRAFLVAAALGSAPYHYRATAHSFRSGMVRGTHSFRSGTERGRTYMPTYDIGARAVGGPVSPTTARARTPARFLRERRHFGLQQGRALRPGVPQTGVYFRVSLGAAPPSRVRAARSAPSH